MYANVIIETETQPQLLAIPDEAVIHSGKRSLAIVALGESRFEPRQVALEIDSGKGWVEVRAGIQDGEDVVTSGQFLIDSESRLQEAVQKLLAPIDQVHDDQNVPSTPAEHEMPPAPIAHEEHAMPEMSSEHGGQSPPSDRGPEQKGRGR